MTVRWGTVGNYAVKFLASQEGLDPHDDVAVSAMLLRLIMAQTAKNAAILKAAREPKAETNTNGK